MMGTHDPQTPLFYVGFDPERRIPDSHPLRQLYADQELKLEDLQSSPVEGQEDKAPGSPPGPPTPNKSSRDDGAGQKINQRMLSGTDPDAAIAQNQRRDPRPRYKHHRAVDDANGVITAVETTGGDIDEGQRLIPLIEQHERHTQCVVKTAIADSKYGTIENFLACDQRQIASHMTELQHAHRKRLDGIFPASMFVYDPATDTYQCPAGHTMRRRRHHAARQSWDYLADKGVCANCSLREPCTRSKKGRSIKRHAHQDRIDRARQQSASVRAKRDRVRRKYLMEGSFAHGANHHGLKRNRWRRLWRQRIQDWLIASVQNVKIVIKAIKRRAKSAQMAVAARIESRIASLTMPLTSFSASCSP